ncbi:MAG TPA: SAM-dependent chlorinase/fluorinase, partial [Gaiellaceae bacterium]|nr:SAM-dependent chlorinase/fluorinase [Gaiellaceae bacterium]
AVVDPGVGGARRALALQADGRWFVGPDNGLLEIVRRRGAKTRTLALPDRGVGIAPTFHGRDVFAPAAAHLARGVPLAEFGPEVALEELRRLVVPEPHIGARRIGATVLYVDRFGNVQLNLTSADLEGVGIVPGATVEIEVGFERYYAIAARTFAEVRRGDIVLYEDAYRNIALAINQGNAAEMFTARVGEELRLAAAER